MVLTWHSPAYYENGIGGDRALDGSVCVYSTSGDVIMQDALLRCEALAFFLILPPLSKKRKFQAITNAEHGDIWWLPEIIATTFISDKVY